MSTLGMVALAAWALCSLVAFRPMFRAMSGDGGTIGWPYLLICIVGSLYFAAVGGPFIVAWLLFKVTVARRVEPEAFAKALAGEPRHGRQARRLRELEERNADLEKRLGL